MQTEINVEWHCITTTSGFGVIFIGKEIPEDISNRYNVVSTMFPLKGVKPDTNKLAVSSNYFNSFDCEAQLKDFEDRQLAHKEEAMLAPEDNPAFDPDLDPYTQFNEFFESEDREGMLVFDIPSAFDYIKPYYIHIFPVLGPVVVKDSLPSVGSGGDYFNYTKTLSFCAPDCPVPASAPKFPAELEPFILSLPCLEGFSGCFRKDKVYNFTLLRETPWA